MLQTVLELLRYISHVPLLLPHMTTKDVTIESYVIPKDTQVRLNAPFKNSFRCVFETDYFNHSNLSRASSTSPAFQCYPSEVHANCLVQKFMLRAKLRLA